MIYITGGYFTQIARTFVKYPPVYLCEEIKKQLKIRQRFKKQDVIY